MDERRTPLYAAHEAAGARFTEFNGWQMPVEYAGIREEHIAVRESVGKFDVSHMGEIEVGGPDATALCQQVTTNDVTELAPGEAQYTMMTDERGVIIDDTVLYRLPATETGVAGTESTYLFVPNAGNDERMATWWREHRDEENLDTTLTNRTSEYGLLAVQGPGAVRLVATVSEGDIESLDRFAATATTIAETPALISRTGYTGEDGLEIFVGANAVADVWEAIDCQPCGLGARDTLRMEMGFLLSGQDFDPDTDPRTPYEAGVGFTVDLDTDFVGREALAAQHEAGPDQLFVGLQMVDRGIPRHGSEIVDGDTVIGTVTSGTMSPTLEEAIGLGYVDAAYADADTEVGVVIRDATKTATTLDPPFIGAN